MKRISLNTVFYPKNLAVVGASDRYGSVGRSVFSQLLAEDICAQLIPINPKHKIIGSLKAYEDLSQAAQEHDLDSALVMVAADKVVGVVREAIKVGVRQVILVNDLNPAPVAVRRYLARAAALAEKAGILLFAVPAYGVGGLLGAPKYTGSAYIGHGESIADCMNNYASERGIRFSRFLPLNPQRDYSVNTGHLIDYIAAEPQTTALLVHIAVLDNARAMVSALAAAAKRKPVVVLSTLPDEHEEQLFIQVLERQHILVARTLTEFFIAAKLIHTRLRVRGNRLMLISNTPSIGALTVKTMAQEGIESAQPSVATQRALTRLLPYKPERINPFYLPSDAATGIVQAALESALNDENTDAVMLIYAGRAHADSIRTAQIAAQIQSKSRKPLLLVWLGSVDTPEIRALFNDKKTLHFRQPEQAVQALTHLNLYRFCRQQRHTLSAFHDYRYAVAAADDVKPHLRPVLPMVSVPASKNALNRLLEALRVVRVRKKITPQLYFYWAQHEHLGQELRLVNEWGSLNVLPPLTPEVAQNGCDVLGLGDEIWRDWLLDAVAILNRLPEVSVLQLELAVENARVVAHPVKLILLDTEHRVDNVFTPYPHTEELLNITNDRWAYVRPVRPEDAILLRQHIESMDENMRYLRFLSRFDTPPEALLARLSHVDYERDYALIVHDQNHHVWATANYTADADLRACEFGISTSADVQGQGVGRLLMIRLIEHARAQGFEIMRAEILADNHPMQKLALKLGFVLNQHPDDGAMVEAKLTL